MSQRHRQHHAAAEAARAELPRLISQLFDANPGEARRRAGEAQRRAERIATLQRQADEALAATRQVQASLTEARAVENIEGNDAEARAAMRDLVSSVF